jgi:hypothetical protein
MTAVIYPAVRILILDDNRTLLGTISANMREEIYGSYHGDIGSHPVNINYHNNNITVCLTSGCARAREFLAAALESDHTRVIVFSDYHIRNTLHDRAFRDLHSRAGNAITSLGFDSGAEVLAHAIQEYVKHNKPLTAFSISDDPESMLAEVDATLLKITCAIPPELIQLERLGKRLLSEREKFIGKAQRDSGENFNITATAAQILAKLQEVLIGFGAIQSPARIGRPTSPQFQSLASN